MNTYIGMGANKVIDNTARFVELEAKVTELTEKNIALTKVNEELEAKVTELTEKLKKKSKTE